MCLLFAATYPERVAALVLYNPIAKGTWAPDYPWAGQRDAPSIEELRRTWGTAAFAERHAREMAPSFANDADFILRLARTQRLAASPAAAMTTMRMAMGVDVRAVPPAIPVPTV